MATVRKIVCPGCGAKLKFSAERITTELLKFKCPGCNSVIRLKKPDPAQERTRARPPAADAMPQTGQKAETKAMPEAEKEAGSGRKSLPGDMKGAGPPEKRPNRASEPEGLLLEAYEHEKLTEYEEGEAGAGDLEWTRYADQKGRELTESKIDMDELPVSAPGLKETLADLRQAEVYNLHGETHLERNLPNQAIRDFNHALEINPDYVDALINRGSAYVLLGQYHDALKDFNHALDLEKRDPEIYNIRGKIYLLNHLYDQAIKDFTAAIILNPIYSDAYLNRGRAYNEKGMKKEAAADFNQAVKADADQFIDYTDLADPLWENDEETSRDKDLAAKYLQQGLANLKGKKYREAAANFTQTINLRPRDAEGFMNRGLVYLKTGRPHDAMSDFNRAVLFAPLNATLYFCRAQVWKVLDSQINMIEDLKLACELGYEPACLEYSKHSPPGQN